MRPSERRRKFRPAEERMNESLKQWRLIEERVERPSKYLGDQHGLGDLEPLQIQTWGDGREDVRVSFIVPIHNQVARIVSNLESVVASAETPHEFILILDSCTDGSDEAVLSWARKSGSEATVGVTV